MRWPGRVPPYWLGMLIAVSLLIIGIAGLVLPLLQGMLFIALGILLIMEYHHIPFLEKYRKIFKKKYERWKRSR